MNDIITQLGLAKVKQTHIGVSFAGQVTLYSCPMPGTLIPRAAPVHLHQPAFMALLLWHCFCGTEEDALWACVAKLFLTQLFLASPFSERLCQGRLRRRAQGELLASGTVQLALLHSLACPYRNFLSC